MEMNYNLNNKESKVSFQAKIEYYSNFITNQGIKGISVSIEEACNYFTITDVEGEYVELMFSGNAYLVENNIKSILVTDEHSLEDVLQFLLSNFSLEWLKKKLEDPLY